MHKKAEVWNRNNAVKFLFFSRGWIKHKIIKFTWFSLGNTLNKFY